MRGIQLGQRHKYPSKLPHLILLSIRGQTEKNKTLNRNQQTVKLGESKPKGCMIIFENQNKLQPTKYVYKPSKKGFGTGVKTKTKKNYHSKVFRRIECGVSICRSLRKYSKFKPIFYSRTRETTAENVLEKIKDHVLHRHYIRLNWGCKLRHIEEDTSIFYYQRPLSPWFEKFSETEAWVLDMENLRLAQEDIKRPDKKKGF